MNSSATEASTTIRFGEMQLCPALRNRPRGGHGGHPRQVGVGEDDERVGAAELEHRLLDRVARRPTPTARPARSLPVMVTAPTRGSSISRA